MAEFNKGTRILKDIQIDADITDYKVLGTRTNSQGKKVRILKVKKKKKKTNRALNQSINELSEQVVQLNNQNQSFDFHSSPQKNHNENTPTQTLLNQNAHYK